MTSPSLSLAWWPVAPLRLRASGGRSFRSPTWTERYYVAPDNVGNPDLDPESAWSADAGFDAYFASTIRVGASGFVRDATDLIDWARVSSDAPYVTRNVHSARFRGVEVDAEAAGPLGTRLTARGFWTSVASSSEAGVESKYALRPLVEGISASMEAEVPGPLLLVLRGARERRVEENPYFVVDARGTAELAGFRVWADLRNAFDEGYDDISRQPAPGRSVSIGIEWRTGS